MPTNPPDLSHHLSDLSKARETSPLKGLQKFFSQPGILSLAGGLPSPAYFPLSDISVNALIPESFALIPAEHSPSSLSWFWKLFGANKTKERTSNIIIPKYPTSPTDINLASSLQYGAAVAQTQLQDFLSHFVAEVYQPAIRDYTVLIDTGNTDGWNRAVLTLCNPGEGVLCEEWTYPSAMAAMTPSNIQPVPVAIDGQGMSSDDLERILSGWDAEARRMPRPHVMYIIPVGQNPSGSVGGCSRRANEPETAADVIIVEDDPYYFLQLGEYVSKQDRYYDQPGDAKHFLASLSPSFLRFDYEGRTIAPGSRLGWFTCNSLFAERLERQGETSTQAPCGFGQSIVASILQNWTYDGYVRWLRGVRTEYQQRRDFFLDCLADEFLLQERPAINRVWSGCRTYNALLRPKTNLDEKYPLQSRTMFSFVPPVAGMFVWMKLHLDEHPSFTPGNEESMEMKLWVRLAENGVVFSPGWMFNAGVMGVDKVTGGESGHFRISFSNAEYSELRKAVKIFGRVIRVFFEEQS
ncbi:pyridoxal phosphate-dependent transferase [Phlebopus sp. FC_14]|nr:pyridoxal phosphate-dependent transferase [Phlebopus sp. FC_14]